MDYYLKCRAKLPKHSRSGHTTEIIADLFNNKWDHSLQDVEINISTF